MNRVFLFAGLLPLALSCRRDDDPQPGQLISITDEAAGANCENGGLKVEVGMDTSLDQVLDGDEVTASYFVCDGAEAPPATLVDVSDEAAGTNCVNGGSAVNVGTDDDGDGTLDASEIDQTAYICDSASAGMVDVQDEAAGTNCEFGGIAVNTGSDDNGNGTLDTSEIADTNYLCAGEGVSMSVEVVASGSTCVNGGYTVLTGHDDDGDGAISLAESYDTVTLCNGEDGSSGTDGQDGNDGKDAVNQLVDLSVEAPGSNCADGGTAVKSGGDDNADGVLQSTEVDATKYVCDGGDGSTSLVDTAAEPAGPNCTYGGTAVLSGIDANANATLDTSEVATTNYVCDPVGAQLPVMTFTSEGLTDVNHNAANGLGYSTIPDMSLNFTLDGDYIVLTEFAINYEPATGGASVANRLVVDSQIDRNWTMVQPSSAGEDDAIHLFRVDTLAAGAHTIKAEWGEGSGVMASRPGSAYYWMRRISAIAIPVDRGVKAGMVFGTTDATHPASGNVYTTVPGMTTTVNLTEESIVLTEFDMNWWGADSNWSAVRLKVDAALDKTSAHSQPEGGTDEDDHMHLFRIDKLAAGSHTLTAEWGQGAGTMNNSAGTNPAWGRRLGYIAIPTSTGAVYGYSDPNIDISRSAGAYAAMAGNDLRMELTQPGWYTSVSLDTMNFYGASGSWIANRLNVDGKPDLRAIHAQPFGGDEDDMLFTHRVDYLAPGWHTVSAEWGDGGGSVQAPAGSGCCGIPWTHRVGSIAIPVAGY